MNLKSDHIMLSRTGQYCYAKNTLLNKEDQYLSPKEKQNLSIKSLKKRNINQLSNNLALVQNPSMDI